MQKCVKLTNGGSNPGKFIIVGICLSQFLPKLKLRLRGVPVAFNGVREGVLELHVLGGNARLKFFLDVVGDAIT